MRPWQSLAVAIAIAGFTGRAIVLVIAARGMLAVAEMGLHAKLVNEITLDMWDFNQRTPAFFANYLSIIVLCAAISYYASKFSPMRGSAARRHAVN